MFAQGRPYLAIPGPSVIPDGVLQAMHRPAPNIYAGELHEVTASLMPDLRAVARTEGDVAIYIGNGHAAWEAALANVVAEGDLRAGAGDRPLRPRLGRDGAGLGVEVETLDFGQSTPVDPARLEERLRPTRRTASRRCWRSMSTPRRR